MADILTVLPGVTLDRLEAMTLGEIAGWHGRAIARHKAQQREG